MADQRFRRPSVRLAIPVVALVLASCGGSEEPAAEEPAVEAEAAVTTTVAPAPTTTEVPATTEAPTTTVAEVNYAAAVVVVANASSVNGSAGRMSDILSAAGYTMGSATNSTEGQLGATKVYYATGDDAAQAEPLRCSNYPVFPRSSPLRLTAPLCLSPSAMTGPTGTRPLLPAADRRPALQPAVSSRTRASSTSTAGRFSPPSGTITSA